MNHYGIIPNTKANRENQMRNKSIRFADFECLLLKLGFSKKATLGPQKLFENAAHNALILLPAYETREEVRDLHVISARKLITERGIVDEDEFDKMLEEFATTRDCTPVA
ncbi:MAG TPA: hypothetical protein VKU00_02745 [Chthonomonadaceae bacterium]|nr:hypothetical protein [Chthonomonadaceae bacterium]